MNKKDEKTLERHSNRITDLTMRGASREQIAEAVEESRRFIDEVREKAQGESIPRELWDHYDSVMNPESSTDE